MLNQTLEDLVGLPLEFTTHNFPYIAHETAYLGRQHELCDDPIELHLYDHIRLTRVGTLQAYPNQILCSISGTGRSNAQGTFQFPPTNANTTDFTFTANLVWKRGSTPDTIHSTCYFDGEKTFIQPGDTGMFSSDLHINFKGVAAHGLVVGDFAGVTPGPTHCVKGKFRIPLLPASKKPDENHGSTYSVM